MALHIDRVTTLEARERGGVQVYLVREALVSGLVDTDHQVLWSALAEAGIPEPGSSPAGEVNLILTERNARLVSGDYATVVVTLIYEHFTNEMLNLDDITWFFMYLKERNSLRQTTASASADGDTLDTVEHTWAATDPDWPGETHNQAPEIEILVPERIITLDGLLTCSTPRNLADAMIGHVNEYDWLQSGDAGTWLCTAADYDPWAYPLRQKWHFEWQYRRFAEFNNVGLQWHPVMKFIDPRTGQPPIDLTTDGIAQGVYYDTARFDNLAQLFGEFA